jgi:prophage DNA circulation protein
MDWNQEQIRTASFKGVEFRCVLTAGYRGGKRHKIVEYPNRPGGLAWDGGRRPATIDMTALFMDDEYPFQSNYLIDACEALGPGTLVHPTRGEINVLAIDWSEDLSGDGPNQASLKLSFVEVGQGAQAWKRVVEILNPEARAETLASSLDTSLDYSAPTSFSAYVGTFMAVLALPSVTLSFQETALASAIQGIRALADAIDTSTDPLRFDYIAEAYLLGQLLIETMDLQAGRQTKLSLYLVQRDMTLLDVAAEAGCTEDEILQYNSVGDPLLIPARTSLIVP